jgi:hypothetical protein
MIPGVGQMAPAVALGALEIEADPGEVLRYLGYPAGATPDRVIRERVQSGIEAARGKLRPRGVYSMYPIVRQTRRSLTLGDISFTGPIGEFLTGAQSVAVLVGTAGPEVLRMADEAFAAGDRITGLIYNALGSHLADAVVERILDDLRQRLAPGETLTLPYSPGYCGIPLSQQQVLFRLVDAGRIGVELLPTFIMKPLKSVSGIVGIGPKDAVTAYGNPCDKCPLETCRMRR